MKSSVPRSAQWRSSKTIATGETSDSRSKNVRHAGNSSSELMPDSTPSSTSSARSIQRRSSGSAMCSSTLAVIRARVVAWSSLSRRPARPRIISPSAQNVIPSPYEGLRPSCHQTPSSSPSMYLRNSHASRLLPIPAGPTTDTSRARFSRVVEWKKSFSWRSSSSRPTNGASTDSRRLRPPTSATTRRARHARTGATLPFRTWSPASSNAIAVAAAWNVAAPTSTDPAGATDCRRDGGVDEVAGDHALIGGTDRDRGLAGEHAGAGLDARREPADGGHEIEAGADGPLRVVLASRPGRPRRPSRHRR